jgi:hypothetical protein
MLISFGIPALIVYTALSAAAGACLHRLLTR